MSKYIHMYIIYMNGNNGTRTRSRSIGQENCQSFGESFKSEGGSSYEEEEFFHKLTPRTEFETKSFLLQPSSFKGKDVSVDNGESFYFSPYIYRRSVDLIYNFNAFIIWES